MAAGFQLAGHEKLIHNKFNNSDDEDEEDEPEEASGQRQHSRGDEDQFVDQMFTAAPPFFEQLLQHGHPLYPAEHNQVPLADPPGLYDRSENGLYTFYILFL